MRSMMKAMAALAIAAAAVSLQAQAHRGPGPSAGPAWQKLTDLDLRNNDEAALARTPDGTLHVIWTRPTRPGSSDYVHVAIDAAGKFTDRGTPALQDWRSLSVPGLVVLPDGRLQIVFGGIGPSGYSEGSLYVVTGDGAQWKLERGAYSSSTNAYAGDVSAALDASGKPVAVWSTSYGVAVQLRMAREKPVVTQNACCGYHPNIATDAASGETVAGWYSNATRQNGYYTETVLPQRGAMLYLTGSADQARDNSLSADQRMPLVSRLGADGVYAAYCTGYPVCTGVNVIRHGAAQPMVVAKAPRATRVGLARAPEGRLWVMWVSGPKLVVARSNRAASRWGPQLTVPAPAGTQTIWKTGGDGSNGPLDAILSCDPGGRIGFWHAQILPPLEVSYSASGGKLNFVVSDVGDPVGGATVSIGGRAATTDPQGRATLAGAASGQARVTAAGYRDAILTVGKAAGRARR